MNSFRYRLIHPCALPPSSYLKARPANELFRWSEMHGDPQMKLVSANVVRDFITAVRQVCFRIQPAAAAILSSAFKSRELIEFGKRIERIENQLLLLKT